jgi:hypothetical protein
MSVQLATTPHLFVSCEQNVADVLEHETRFAIIDWLSRVNAASKTISVWLPGEERCAHLPEMFHDIVARLRASTSSRPSNGISLAAHNHGFKRHEQGYTPIMMIEESRIVQIAIFETLQLNLRHMDTALVLGDVMTIADEVQSQLAQAMTGYYGKDQLTALSRTRQI